MTSATTPSSQAPARVPVSAWPTPKRLRAFMLLVAVGAALLLLVGETTLNRARNATKTIRFDAAPSIVAALEIRALLADLDANASNILLDSVEHSARTTQVFENVRIRVAARLVDAAQNITYGETERAPIIAILTDLGRYLELLGEAHFRYDNKDPMGAIASYRAATDLMHVKILAAAEALDKANKDVMNDVYDAQSSASRGSETGAVVAGGALVVALLWTQIFVFRRTRRIFNVPLVIATVLAFVFTGYLVGRFGAARADLRVAKEDAFQSIHTIWKARALAYDANGDESRSLLDSERERSSADSFRAKVSQLSSAPDFPTSYANEVGRKQQVSARGLFADEFNNVTFPGEREAAVAMAKAFAAYYALDAQMRALQAKGDRAGASRLYLERSNDAFVRFDGAAAALIDLNMGVFQRVLAEGDAGLKTAEILDPLFAIVIALLGYLGLRARLREYA